MLNRSDTGLRRYLYEYLFYRGVEAAKAQMPEGRTVRVSQARAMRTRLDAVMAERGHDISSSEQGVNGVLQGIDRVLGESVPDYQPVFGDGTIASPAYQQMSADFMSMVGFDMTAPDGTVRRADPGPSGSALPISPYDPRFSGRSTVRSVGSSLLAVPQDVVALAAGNEVARVATSQDQSLMLSTFDERSGKLVEQGPAQTLEDASGLTALMPRMSRREYEDVREWVIDGARGENGRIDRSRFMSEQALARAEAVLDELDAQGTPYKVSRDLRPGQIRAQLEGTRISVRLTDTRENENYVGRVYDDGMQVTFSTDVKTRGSNVSLAYHPTPDEAVDLLRFVQGKPVRRKDDPSSLVGEPGTLESRSWDARHSRMGTRKTNASYWASGAQMSCYGAFSDPADPGNTGNVYVRRDVKERSARMEMFSNPERAEQFLREAVDSARAGLTESLDAEGLIRQVQDNAELVEAGEYVPELSAEPQVAAMQRGYWDVLTGVRSTLLRPGVTPEQYEELLTGADVEDVAELERARQQLSYGDDPVESVRAHAADTVEALVGTYDPAQTPEGPKTFDPVGVAAHMDSPYSPWRNTDDLVSAMRAVDVDPSQLRGSGFDNDRVKDRLIRFDPTTAVPMATHEDPFVARMGQVVEQSLLRNGVVAEHVDIDANGVVDWSGTRQKSKGVTSKNEEQVSGQIGQIFAPGEHGEIVTSFASGDNHLFVPGYEAWIMPQAPGEAKTVEERTRLRGYEQVMAESIEYRLANDLVRGASRLGEPTALNSTYRRLYDERHDVDFLTSSLESGLTQQWRDAILATEARRVRYPNEIRDGSTMNAEYQAQYRSGGIDPADDNHRSAWNLTEGRNMAIMTREGDGYFDPIMTSGSTNQGIVRYLVESAEVSADGSVIPGDPEDRTPLLKHEDTRFMRFNPQDRQQMTAANLIKAAAVTEPVGSAQMSFGGWTMDDPMVVSKDFAHRHQISSHGKEPRDLVVGDKLSDLNGNKGVISLIVDPDMDDAEAERQGISQAVAWFRANPGLDVVTSPFSAVSRFNGGSARELMESPQDLVDPATGEVREATMGSQRFIVTPMSADAKTRIYDEDDVAAQRSRKVSSQLAWALSAQGADEVMAECYGTNDTSVANFREMLVTMGLDMEPDGTLSKGYDQFSESNRDRRVFEMPELGTDTNGGLDVRAAVRDFGREIGDKGGILELPYPLRFPTGEELPKLSEDSWGVPVLSSHLRAGREFENGVTSTHDYTNHYMSIHEYACKYRNAVRMLENDRLLRDDPAAFEALGLEDKERSAYPLKPKKREEQEKVRDGARRMSQMAFDSITSDLATRRFSGKHNVFKNSLMANHMPDSATAVLTSDPRLRIDQLAMGPAMMSSMGVSEGESVLVWRDPMLRDSGVRYMEVVEGPELTGVAINPVMDKCFDGDFDGDTVGVVKLNTQRAKDQAKQLLSVEANLLDLGSKDGQGLYSLNMQDSLDVKVAQHRNPELAERFASLTEVANEVHADFAAGRIDRESMLESNRELVTEISEYYHEALSGEYGGAMGHYKDVPSHLVGVMRDCVETGAKGSAKKVRDYAHYLGADPDTFADLGDTQATREDHEAVQYATAVKSFGTGVAGTFSQRGVKALRNAEFEGPAADESVALNRMLRALPEDSPQKAVVENLKQMIATAGYPVLTKLDREVSPHERVIEAAGYEVEWSGSDYQDEPERVVQARLDRQKPFEQTVEQMMSPAASIPVFKEALDYHRLLQGDEPGLVMAEQVITAGRPGASVDRDLLREALARIPSDEATQQQLRDERRAAAAAGEHIPDVDESRQKIQRIEERLAQAPLADRFEDRAALSDGISEQRRRLEDIGADAGDESSEVDEYHLEREGLKLDAMYDLESLHDELDYARYELDVTEDLDRDVRSEWAQTLGIDKDMLSKALTEAGATQADVEQAEQGRNGEANVLKSVLELTYPATQSVLQAKHDPEEARIKYHNLMGPARELWRGRLLEPAVDDHGAPTWKAVRDEDGKPVQADAEVWREQFMDVYTAEHGLNVSIDPDHVDTVARALTDPQTGTMLNIEDDSYDKSSPMDTMAYGGDFSTLVELAEQRQNLFDGQQNGHFAPFSVRRNQRALARQEQAVAEHGFGSPEAAVPELVPLLKKDTRAMAPSRGSQRRSDRARAIGGPSDQALSRVITAERVEPAPSRVVDQSAQSEWASSVPRFGTRSGASAEQGSAPRFGDAAKQAVPATPRFGAVQQADTRQDAPRFGAAQQAGARQNVLRFGNTGQTNQPAGSGAPRFGARKQVPGTDQPAPRTQAAGGRTQPAQPRRAVPTFGVKPKQKDTGHQMGS